MMKFLINNILLLAIIAISLEGLAQGTDKNISFADYLSIYQKFISPIKGSHCPMYPSCSEYGMLAFKTQNPLTAFTMTAERLMRCGHEHKFYDITLQDNGFRLIDFPDSLLFDEGIVYSDNKSFYAFSDTVYPKNQSLEFIKYLINQQFFQQALLEISRSLYSGNNEHKVELYTNYLICLRALEMQEKGIFEFENIFPKTVKHNSNLLTEVANLWLDLANYSKANEYYQLALSNTNDFENKNALLLRSAYTQLKQQNLNLAIENYRQIPKNSFQYQNAQSNILAIEQLRSIKIKKPAIAGLLSIIPGLGYLYASHKQTALSAFIINSVLMYGTYSSIKKENYGMAALSGIFSFSFYIGNISGSVKSTNRYNKVQTENYLDKIIK